MMFVLLFVAISMVHSLPIDQFGLALDNLALDSLALDADMQQPPQANPNVRTNVEGHDLPFADPLAHVSQSSRVRAATQCNFPAIIAATGNTLVQQVRDAPPTCLYALFSVSGADAKNGCNEPDVTAVANAFASVTTNYDGTKPASSAGILNYALYLRACYYAQTYNSKDIGAYSANLLPIIKRGIDNFLRRPNFETNNREHFEISRETITLITNVGEQLNFVSILAQLLPRLGEDRGQGEMINAIFDNLFRSHDPKDKAEAFYKQHPEVATGLNDFMDRRANFVGTENEWLLRNAGGELARLLKYQATYSTVSGYVKKQMQKYLANANGLKVWAWMANIVGMVDVQNCGQYGACNIKGDMEKKVLTYTKACPVTKSDTFKIRAQQISDAEADIVCKRLKEQENYYHNLMKSGWIPVSPDTNTLIEVVIFNNVDEYKLWANLIFGISTDNGGMYIEGDPSKAGNVARYFCYEQSNNGKFDVWNLEHEFTHYLDGRYAMQNNFAETSRYQTVWWGEGFAEYAANKNQYPTTVNNCKAKKYTLSQIFTTTYSHDTERIYHYGYLAARYMFEKHRADVDNIVRLFRAGKYADYDKFLAGLGTKYDQDFASWCTTLAG